MRRYLSMRGVWVLLGVVLLGMSLAGAKHLSNGQAQPSASHQLAHIQPVQVRGLLVLGTVDSEPPPVAYGLPPVLQSGTIVKVFVQEHQLVRVGDPLYAFDTSLLERDLEIAQAQLELAKAQLDEARVAVEQHHKTVALMEESVANAEEKVQIQTRLYNLIRNNLENFWRNQQQPKLTEEEIRKKLQDDDKLFEAQAKYTYARRESAVEQKKLAQLRALDPYVKVRQAEAGVRRVEAELNKAKTAIAMCTVRAKSDGAVERITISPGTTLGISTREAALWLVPTGKRVVRAEIEAEFAHRVTPDLIGKTITIYDNSDPRLTYTGTLKRLSSAFLPKRSSGEALLANDTRVLEAVVEVDDPAPPGKPPLRVGQRVRVALGP